MEIIKISIIIAIATILFSVLPIYDKAVSSLINLTVCILITVYIVNYSRDIIQSVKQLIGEYFPTEFSVVYKTMGISLITGFVHDIAVDNGHKSLANQMEFAGKIAITFIAMPLFIQILEIIKGLIE